MGDCLKNGRFNVTAIYKKYLAAGLETCLNVENSWL